MKQIFVPIEPDRTMQIEVTDMSVSSMKIKGKGIELRIRESDGKHVGDLVITNTKITWNKGRTSVHGKKINWPEFIKFMQKRPS